jgi:small subunit ribosomal protein S20
MPNIKSAKKKMRQDKKRQEVNSAYKSRYKKAVKKYVSKPTKEQLKETVSLVDRAAKKGVIHKNKASRLKARLSKVKK